jgi:hypothetical protein
VYNIVENIQGAIIKKVHAERCEEYTITTPEKRAVVIFFLAWLDFFTPTTS